MTRARFAVLAPAVLVAGGAVAATAHGLYEVAVAAGVPPGIGWLYPVITDGLALVAYAATRQLSRVGYAWTVVVVAAGLSGMAQATYLAAGAGLQAGMVLRFGVGAWPAVAAAVVAHLVFLLAHRQAAARTVADLVAEREAESPSIPPESPTTQDSGGGETATAAMKAMTAPVEDSAADDAPEARVPLHLAPPLASPNGGETDDLPARTSVYRLFDASGSLLYVGVTSTRIETRLASHRRSKPWWGEVASTSAEEFETREEALDAERTAIAEEQPRYNEIHPKATSDFYTEGTFHDWLGRRQNSSLNHIVEPEECSVDTTFYADLIERTRPLLPIGRPRLARELGITDYQARRVLELINGVRSADRQQA